VGDQKGGITESKANISPENDDDWIKISEYVKKLNPTILDDSTTALNRRKWRGEGVQQAVFEQPCVHAVSSLTIACSSDTMGVRVSALLSSLLGAGGTSGDALQCGGLLFKVQPMATDWVRSLRASMCKQPDKARFEALEFAVHTSLDTLQQTCAEREVAFEQEGDVTCLLTPSTLKPGGLMSQMGLALSKDVDSGSPRFSVRVLDEVAPCAPAQATAVPRDDVAMEVRVKEIVFGSEWQEHGPFEVCIYAHTHTPKLTQHTHSHTHTHTHTHTICTSLIAHPHLYTHKQTPTHANAQPESVQTHTNKKTQTKTHTHTHTHTRTHTHTHTHSDSLTVSLARPDGSL